MASGFFSGRHAFVTVIFQRSVIRVFFAIKAASGTGTLFRARAGANLTIFLVSLRIHEIIGFVAIVLLFVASDAHNRTRRE